MNHFELKLIQLQAEAIEVDELKLKLLALNEEFKKKADDFNKKTGEFFKEQGLATNFSLPMLALFAARRCRE